MSTRIKSSTYINEIREVDSFVKVNKEQSGKLCVKSYCFNEEDNFVSKFLDVYFKP